MNTPSASLAAPEISPRVAALVALRELPAPEPVPALEMVAAERLAIIGEAAVAIGWAERLAAQRQVTVLALDALPDDFDGDASAGFAVEPGTAVKLSGHLGAFEVHWLAVADSKPSGVIFT